MSFDVDAFVEQCLAAVKETDAPERIAAILHDTIAHPDAIAFTLRQRNLGKSPSPMVDVFLNTDELTIYHVAFPPNLFGVPHDHAGWAVIGVYSGAEAFNVYGEEGGKLMRGEQQIMRAPAVQILAPDLIHDIENPSEITSGSIHVYGNRHFDMPARRIWRDGSNQAEPFTFKRSLTYGVERTQRIRRERGIDDLDLQGILGLADISSQ